MWDRVESGFELGIKCFDIMRNYQLSQKLKLLGYDEFNYLTNILIVYVVQFTLILMMEIIMDAGCCSNC